MQQILFFCWKKPSYMVLFHPTCLFIFEKISYLYVCNILFKNNIYSFYCSRWSKLYWSSFKKAYLMILNYEGTVINCLIFMKSRPIETFRISYNFKKFLHNYYLLHVYLFWGILPSYMIIWYPIVRWNENWINNIQQWKNREKEVSEEKVNFERFLTLLEIAARSNLSVCFASHLWIICEYCQLLKNHRLKVEKLSKRTIKSMMWGARIKKLVLLRQLGIYTVSCKPKSNFDFRQQSGSFPAR